MTYDYELLIGERLYSSWSLRGWLLFSKFDINVATQTANIYETNFSEKLAQFHPSRLVPSARLDGQAVWDSLAIAEELNTRHPEKQMWPASPDARAMARSLSAEMHSGFSALRDDCTMNLRHSYTDFKPTEETLKDVARIDMLWSMAKEAHGKNGPWLFGSYSIADVFYAPIVTRFATYGLPVSQTAQAYIDTTLADQTFRRWRAMGVANRDLIERYEMPSLTHATWPGPTPLKANAVEGIEAENAVCPYSGKEITHTLEIDGRRFGFCNAFCRDKTIADPLAWPDFVKIYEN